MHHYYPPPPPPYGYPPQQHFAPYPPASPVKSPGNRDGYPSQHASYFPSMTPPRFNHEHDRGGPEDGGPKNDEEMKGPEAAGQRGTPSDSSVGNKASNLKVYVKPKGQNI